ncbi:MarR family transcriptional regulator [Haloarcula hispanica N601]|jgi:predicted transcriptional regulator|uniref:MarR family transcriptional regulator n=6 Tax=Haloarcula TaxID=2237 RepID=Q5V1A9_HALMA|nr:MULTISPECIES: MarR family transcriptional regulator [Haloarcula]AAV46694.1 transcription regulator [Haloarcula marismortui ATCC 43049]AEM57919.1 transcription regulator [Haloarcula hispanica ATCC 33960]AHB66668.1 MarR family transcriptional regulator [Haloarcula hispanica N601]EMA15920.1 transcription regulator [Haloarcula sinaiiensis ATCC 33800]EMA20573.1 transcription regulator [Haloarcula californiae ATCC 33799]
MTREGDVDEDKRATLRRFAALGAASPFARFGDSGSESDAPDAIAGYVSAHPGTHFSKLRDDLKLGTGEAQHHLHRLENEAVVTSQKDGDYRRYFPADQFSEFEQVALGYLRRSTARGMLVTLLRRPDVTASELASELDVSRPTVSNYAADLESAGLLSRENGYAVTEPETVLTLLIRYADSFGDDVAALAGEADSLLRYDP